MPRLLLIAASALFAQAGAQTAPLPKAPTRVVLASDSTWVDAISEPASGRFTVYARDSTIRIYNKASKRTYVIQARFRRYDGNVGISRTGNLIAFVRGDDNRSVPYVWTQALDTLTGEPQGSARRISLVKSRVAQPSSDGRFVAFVSDDGNHNAVSGGTRLWVVPSSGGTARMLDSAGQGIGQPRWSPDDKIIYYERRPALMRLRVEGGRRDSIGVTGSFIDVSHDGQLLAFISGPALWNQGGHTINIARNDGTILTRINARTDRPKSWAASGRELLATRSFEPSRMRAVNLRDGSVSPLPLLKDRETRPEEHWFARYSDDGTMLAIQWGRLDSTRTGPGSTLSIYDLKAGNRRDIVVARHATQHKWSPDGRYISFLEPQPKEGNPEYVLYIVEVASGKERALGSLGPQTRYRWRSDSKALEFIGRDAPANLFSVGPTMPMGAWVSRITITGTKSRVRDLDAGPTGAFFRIVNDSIVVRGSKSSGFTLFNTRTGTSHTLYSGPIYDSGNASVLASPDGNRILFAAANGEAVQLVEALYDGSSHRRLGSPYCAVWAAGWLAGGREILADGWDCEKDRQIYMTIPIDGSPSRLLPVRADVYGDVGAAAFAPDGTTLLYAEPATQSVWITAIDFSALLKGKVPPK